MRGLPSSVAGTPPASRFGMVAQACLVLAIGMLVLAPPPRGLMLVVPLTPSAAATLERVAADAGGQLAGPGPLPGSRYVEAERGALLPAALAHGLLLLNGAPRLCTPYSGTPK